MSVTTKSIITASPSIWVPTVNLTPPFCHQVTVLMTGFTTVSWSPPWAKKPFPNAWSTPPADLPSASFTRWIHWTAVTHASTNDTPSAVMPISEPCLGILLPKNRISTNEAAGIAGMSQA